MDPSEIPPAKPEPGKPTPNEFTPAELSKDACTMAMLAHLLGGLFCIPGPLIIWLLKKDTEPFVDDQAKEALNFQLTILIGHFVAAGLAGLTCVLFFSVAAPPVVGLIFGIIGCIEANKGVAYRYPFSIRMVK